MRGRAAPRTYGFSVWENIFAMCISWLSEVLSLKRVSMMSQSVVCCLIVQQIWVPAVTQRLDWEEGTREVWSSIGLDLAFLSKCALLSYRSAVCPWNIAHWAFLVDINRAQTNPFCFHAAGQRGPGAEWHCA